jgi:hypothetical protein
MRRLKNWFNPESSKVIKGLLSGRELMVEGTDVAFFFADISGEPKKFHEAESDVRVKWRVAIYKGFEDVKNKWIFKIKRDGVFRARLLACGYSQVLGIDFTDRYTPVIDDVSFRIILIDVMAWNLKAKIIEIETAFLHGDLEESIFMEIPSGMEVDDNKCLVLKRTIYGLVQSVRKFYVKLIKALKICGFKGSLVNPFL